MNIVKKSNQSYEILVYFVYLYNCQYFTEFQFYIKNYDEIKHFSIKWHININLAQI